MAWGARVSGPRLRRHACGSPASESGLDGAKGRFQIRAKALHNRNDRDRDAGGDEAIFDGRRSRLVFNKASEKIGQWEISVVEAPVNIKSLLRMGALRVPHAGAPAPVGAQCGTLASRERALRLTDQAAAEIKSPCSPFPLDHRRTSLYCFP